MKITKELKFVMQFNSFVGMAASMLLIKVGVHTALAYAGFVVNALCLIHWIVIGETENGPAKE